MSLIAFETVLLTMRERQSVCVCMNVTLRSADLMENSISDHRDAIAISEIYKPRAERKRIIS